MIEYLIKSALCLALLLAFYHLVLEREKMHQFNRFYLLGSVIFSFLVPFYVIYVEVAPVMTETLSTIQIPESHKAYIQEDNPGAEINFYQILLTLYILISSLFLLRFFKSLIDIFLMIKTSQVIPIEGAKVVLVKDHILPHSFWNYIFINKDEYESGELESELLTHELTHVTQKHTIDVLLIEILKVVFWFNPLFYLLKRAIQLNHEFLADEHVISSHQNIPKYQYLLLDKATWNNKYYLASNLNYLVTKKRLKMMKAPNSKLSMLVKKLALLPLLMGFVYVFADRVEAQSKKEPTIIEIKEKTKGATEAQMEFYKTVLKQGTTGNKIFKLRDLNMAREIYAIMSKEQKRSVKNINSMVPPDPPTKDSLKVIAVKIKETRKKYEKSDKADKKAKIIIEEPKKKAKGKTTTHIEAPKKAKKAKVKIIEIQEEKPKKDSKVVKEIIKIEPKEDTEIEIIETVPEEEVIIEVLETPEVVEEIENLEVIEETESIVEVKSDQNTIKKTSNGKSYQESIIRLKGLENIPEKNITYYLDGKKISKKKADRWMKKKGNKIKSINVYKDKKKKTARIEITTQ